MAITTADLVSLAKQTITEISTTQALTMLINNDSIALDVRELLEFEMGHIANSRHISRGMLEFKITSHPDFQDKDSSIIVYCKTGGRSALAAASLEQLGYTNVYSMQGGFDELAVKTELNK